MTLQILDCGMQIAKGTAETQRTQRKKFSDQLSNIEKNHLQRPLFRY